MIVMRRGCDDEFLEFVLDIVNESPHFAPAIPSARRRQAVRVSPLFLYVKIYILLLVFHIVLAFN